MAKKLGVDRWDSTSDVLPTYHQQEKLGNVHTLVGNPHSLSDESGGPSEAPVHLDDIEGSLGSLELQGVQSAFASAALVASAAMGPTRQPAL